MAIQKEIWLADIAENLFQDNQFYTHSTNHSPFVVNGKTVHLPQAGPAPEVLQNRATIPATIAQRTDTDRTYNLDEYTTSPILVKDSEELETSYEKRQAVLREHINALNETVGHYIANAWAPTTAAQMIRTSDSSTTPASAPAATGTRKKIAKADIISLAKKLDEQGFPREGRYLLLPTSMYYQLFDIADFVSWDKMNTTGLPDGMIRKVFDFTVITRPKVAIYDDASTPALKAVGATGAAADNQAALAWHESAVCFAQGETKLYINEGEASYYGDVFSAMVRAGGKGTRTDGKGILALIED